MYDTDFVDGLKEACSYAQKGSEFGARAIEEAIKRKSRKRELVFYQPDFTIRTPEEYVGVKDQLLNLAKMQELLTDPFETQSLISCCLSFGGYNDLMELADKILEIGGIDQFYSFQLLYNQMHSSALLRKLHGET
ncbi:MAG: hypothetical protein K9H48_21140 [Melioribacteraceae bacterium]|nr:hypothetical protein [Melioribacteraceae bacterium]MCF8396389.1 hypothetical protein [Melioribacteraceae bacterium]